jgi:hypothetical protein
VSDLLLSPYHLRFFSAIANDAKPSGSFLFFGESQIGKRSFAMEIAKSLENGAKVLSETLVISPDPEKGTINIDAVREMRIFLSERPIGSPARIVIIDSAESMTFDAEDAILKIVEEPPEYAVIILISSDADAIVPTLVSRCRRIYFPRAGKEIIKNWLVNGKNIPLEDAERAVKLSFGRPGLALDIAEGRLDPWKKATKKEESFDFELDADYLSFVKRTFIRLYDEKVSNLHRLRELSKRVSAIAEHNKSWKLNRKMQLKASLTGLE